MNLDRISSFQHHRLLRHSSFLWKVGFALTLHRGYDGCTHDKFVLDGDLDLEDLLEEGMPLYLGRLSLEDVTTLLDFLNQLLSTSSSGIETLEIDITYDVDNGFGKRLDNLFTSEKFVSLRKVQRFELLELEMEEQAD